MNLLLLTAEEARGQPVRVTGDRARHVYKVLRKQPGDSIRVGIIDGAMGCGIVRELTVNSVCLDCEFDQPAERLGEDTLLLAVPRPIVLARSLAHAATMGFGRIILFRSQRVEKSHLHASAMTPASIRTRLLDGLAQGRRTRVPVVHRFDRFKPFVEDQLEALVPKGLRILGHPTAERRTADLAIGSSEGAEETPPFTLAIGPEGGFIPYEVAALEACGFLPVRAGEHPLRVETALAFLTGQLALLRELATK